MPDKYAKLIVNPIAGGGATNKNWPEIKQRLTAEGLQYDYEFTKGHNHATEIARKAVDCGYSFIVVVGGDGTVNESANGILTSANRKNATLGVINTGTGSDYIRTLGTPSDPLEACSFLKRKERFLVDVGLVEFNKDGNRQRRFFVNYAGTGFDSEVAEATNRMPKWRYLNSTVPYLLALFKTLACYKNKTVSLNIDEECYTGRVLSVIASNGRYFGGGMKVAPMADLSDGKLDIVTVNDIGKLELLMAFPRIYKGTHVTHPKVNIVQAEKAVVVPVERMPVSADGELLGEGPVSFEIIPQALAVAR
jgi:YegS/Rv2252/BmrU family lipid kinase